MAAEGMLERAIPRNEVCQILRNQIISFEMKPGEMLSENSLSAQMNVGRPMVRDALAQLAEEGYIVVYPQKGTVVTAIDLDRLRQAVHTHIVLEQAAIDEICKKGLEREQEEQLEEALLAQKAEKGGENMLGCLVAEQQFHYLLARFCGKERMWQMFRTMDSDLLRVNYLQYDTFNYSVYASSLTSWEHTQVENRLMLDNLRKRDSEAASLICSNHFNAVLWNGETLRGIYPGFFSG